ncbi:siderophore-interacting protein [Zooshikella ganghwensis]|uniref:siderophore-interacting protein n=1 Tax=Zooshikella ganghwensis TaxID=202772 RepID=UPI002D7EAE38|nr:siderophore-interacting protein [Zooshikella ganghwensis]
MQAKVTKANYGTPGEKKYCSCEWLSFGLICCGVRKTIPLANRLNTTHCSRGRTLGNVKISQKAIDKPSAVKPKRIPPCLLSVVNSTRLSPFMQRITLTGEALKDFPEGCHGAHIKLFFPQSHQQQPILPTIGPTGVVWPAKENKPVTRTYSVRNYDSQLQQLTVDFVLHDESSPASGWALNARKGDKIGLAGPGGPNPLLAPADWHIISGDMTALPAISAILEMLPEQAQGDVFIEVNNPSERQELTTAAKDIKIHWLYSESQPAGTTSLQLEAIQKISKPASVESISAWVAGENTAVINIRNYLKEKYGLHKKNLYAVPYWRYGFNEEGYHAERHKVMDEVY